MMPGTITLSIPADAIPVAAPLPELISQYNVFAVVAIKPPTFLELLRAPGFPLDVIKLGKTRLVDRAAFVSWLKSGAVAATGPANDALAARLGVTAPPKTR